MKVKVTEEEEQVRWFVGRINEKRLAIKVYEARPVK